MSGAAQRLLIIGNSHIAAPRLAYVATPERWPGWDIDFLGLPGGHFGRLILRNGSLAGASEQTARQMKHYNFVKRLDVTGYDAFATVGGFGWLGAAAMADQHRSLEFPSVLAGDRVCQLVSSTFLTHALRSRLRISAAGRALITLKPLGKPVVVLPEPLPSVECGAAPERYGAYRAMVARGDAAYWIDRFRQAAAEQIGTDGHLRLWPDIAIIDGCYSPTDLMRGAPMLSSDRHELQPETDFAHGNAVYGALIMDQIVETLDMNRPL